MSYFVYILECADGTLYTGYTNNLVKRLRDHNESLPGVKKAVGAKYTSGRRPVVMVYQEHLPTKSDALKREYAIKQLTRLEKLALIKKL